ncbi:MAG: LamG-like jellyroll fold domain-containing protein, partial [Verrucomicrobiales bacterium]
NGDAGAADFRTLVAKGEANPAFGLLEAGGELLWFREEGVAFSTNSTPITAGTNYHLVMRLDGESGMGSIFVDGVEVITEAVEAVGDDSGNFYIGAFGGALGFAGTIDDVQIYDLAITNDQVAFLMNNPSKELRPDGPIDSDGDGLSDEDEISTHNTDPLVVDERGGGQDTLEILGTGVEALLGGDLTDPENDGLDEAGAAMDPSWNWVNITGNIEDDFGDPEQSFNIFDNQVGGGGAKWCCDDPSPDNPYWVSVEFAEAVSLTHFTITNGNDSPDRDPTNWQIQGSNDGETFETIFAEDAESIWTEERNEVALVTLASPSAPYKHIRYIVFDTPGALHQLNEIEYFGNVATSLLVNGSFEEPVLDNINTNNLGTVPTGWSQTGDDATWNLIRNDGSAYGSGVDSAADGSQII